jgi:hypothetical protein
MDQLYSQFSHLLKGSIKVIEGQQVKQGEILAYCGNSGRSPIPHLHFQFQDDPSIGSKTIDYPFTSIINHHERGITFHTTSNPGLNEVVSNVQVNELLKNAFKFIPGERIEFEVEGMGDGQPEWEVRTDMYSNTYLECVKTKSKAWFSDLGNVFYFTHFEGDKRSLLYYFYLSSFKVIKTFYQGLVVKDSYPLDNHPARIWLFFQDFLIPFIRFLTASYEIDYFKYSDHSPKEIQLKSKAVFNKPTDDNYTIVFDIEINEKGIREFNISDRKRKITAKRKPNI